MSKSFTPGLYRKVMLGVLVLLPAVLFLFPLHTAEHLPSICLIKAITGHECPGCGMTRACLNVMHGNFADAFDYNKLVVVIFPLLAYIWLKGIVSQYRKIKSI